MSDQKSTEPKESTKTNPKERCPLSGAVEVMFFLRDYNEIIRLYKLELQKLSERLANDPEHVAASKKSEEEAARNMGLSVDGFRVAKESFWSKQKPSKNGLWEIKVLIYFVLNKMEVVSYIMEHTSWRLPNGHELTYTDYSHSWSLDTDDSILNSRTLVNSVWCKKGLLYKFLCNLMRIKAAEYREIDDWKRLNQLSRNAKTYLEPNHFNRYKNDQHNQPEAKDE